MTENHPITPPKHLLSHWEEVINYGYTPNRIEEMLTQAARWGADQELDACCEVLARELICDGKHVATDLRAVRRPKPPSLREEALKELHHLVGRLPEGTLFSDAAIIRAIESLPDEQ